MIVAALRQRRFAGILALALVAALVAGPAAFARLAYLAGYPGVALPFLSDPAVRGAALYDLGRYAEADDTFREIGRRVTYNRGNSLAVTGDYALSRAYFDAVLFANRFDAGARHNREVVAALVVPHEGEAMGRGRIRAHLAEAGVEVAAFDPDNPQVPVAAVDNFRKGVDARTVTANEDWLETLQDAPGEYLKKRLVAEYDRRRAAGRPAPAEAAPW
ncbi:hypothetical protein DLJ53_07395 [Acuticoccus sediminis]|uniref:Ca-activated chloride channel family protein n=1 Tax=Acuticoccus sediminis TaxID=2184697 RepID=A0A8B2P6Q2_9HYPH|nr:hypothetical protein [Acuticoccus sediminis]RAI04259.1 hypothetical protein DLJ53_07395 [Acuticoccus sediminis]